MLAIAGGKGGCGKTTTAVALTAELAQSGATPLLVDGDCDVPDVHHLLDIDRIHDCRGQVPAGASGVDALARGVDLQSATRRPDSFPGIRVLTGGGRDNLDAALTATRRWHGPVVVDCPAGVTPAGTTPFRHADRAVLVTTDRLQCVEDARRTATVVRELGAVCSGFVVRETADGVVDPTLLEERILTAVPTVDRRPVEQPAVRDSLARLPVRGCQTHQ